MDLVKDVRRRLSLMDGRFGDLHVHCLVEMAFVVLLDWLINRSRFFGRLDYWCSIEA